MRRLPPVHSPLSLAALRAAWGGADMRAPLTTELESRYRERRVVLTDSGTSALAVAMRLASGARGGLPCALPGYGCFDLVSAALAAGVRVAMYDVDPISLQPDEDSLRRVAASGIAAVVIVHHYGVPVPIAPLRHLLAADGALVIEDAAQGVGGAVSGVPLGGTGDFGVLSFGRGKGMTGGGGGALLLSDAESRRRAEDELVEAGHGSRARFAITLFAQWLLARPALYALPSALPFLGLGETVFRAPNPPRAMRTDSARVLMQTISLSDREAERRRRNADALRAMLGDDADRLVSVPSARQPGWLRFPVRGARHPSQITRGASLGCVPGYPRSLDTLPEAQAIIAHPPRVPGASELAARLWTVPVHGLLTDRDLRAISAWIRRLPTTASGGATPGS